MPPANVPVFPCMARNRLGTNSLLEALVFGRRAGKSIVNLPAQEWH